MLNLAIDINEDSFLRQVTDGLSVGHSSLHEVLSVALVSEIQKSIENSFTSDQLLNVSVKENSSISAHSISESIASGGYSFWYIQVQIDLKQGNEIRESDIKNSDGIELKSVNYGAESKLLKFKHKVMKTRERYLVELIHVVIPSSTLIKLKDRCGEQCDCANNLLRPVKHGEWEWCQQFGCINCGKRYLCNCFKPAIVKHIKVAEEQKSSYSSSGWPHRFLEAVSESEFRNGICHICTGEPSNLFFCHPMYGSPIRVKYGAYIKKFEIEDDLSVTDRPNGATHDRVNGATKTCRFSSLGRVN